MLTEANSHLQDALERADVRNAMLQTELDEVEAALALSQDETKGLAVAIKFTRASMAGGSPMNATSPTPPSWMTAAEPPATNKGRRRRTPGQHDDITPRQGAAGGSSAASAASSHADSLLDAFRVLLAEVLAMRERGAYDADLLRRYADALVVLPDAELELVYQQLTSLYTGEHTPEVLAWLRNDDGGDSRRHAEVPEAIFGFVEMQVMRIGALLEVPQAARVAKHERDKHVVREEQNKAEKRNAHQAREAELLAAIHAADEAAYAQVLTLATQWAAGEGDDKSVRRYQRRRELQLLLMEPSLMKERVPTHEWSQMMTSGLEKAEPEAGAPAQAAGHLDELNAAVARRRDQAEMGASAQIDPRAEREEQLRRKRNDMLKGTLAAGERLASRMSRRGVRSSNRADERTTTRGSDLALSYC